MARGNEWDKPTSPPPPMFLNQPERDLVAQINNELIEKVIGQIIAYYPIDINTTNFHPLYGEAIIKNFLPPIRIYAFIDWEGTEVKTTGEGIDKRQRITVHFHKRRLTEDQDLFVREGDFICYGPDFYEIVAVTEPDELWGRTEHKMQVAAKCVKARKGLFDAI